MRKAKTKSKRRKSPVAKLPTKASVPVAEMAGYTTLLYGAKKVGKTTLAARFPGAYFLMFEPGAKALAVYQSAVSSWSHFVAYLDLLEAGDHDFKTIVIDTVDGAYQACFGYMCTKLAIDHPQDQSDFGKSWGQIDQEFTRQMLRLLNLGTGAIFISHEKLREITTRGGKTFDRLDTSCATQAQRFLEGIVDIWAHYGYHGTDRFLLLQGSDFVGAGNRLEGNFQTVTGKALVAVPMGRTSAEAYKNLMAAFDNTQKEVHAEVLESLGKRKA